MSVTLDLPIRTTNSYSFYILFIMISSAVSALLRIIPTVPAYLILLLEFSLFEDNIRIKSNTKINYFPRILFVLKIR